MSLLSDELDDLLEQLDQAEHAVNNSAGPLVEPPLTTVTVKLNSARTSIANVLFMIGNLGAADANNLPASLPGIADECVTLAQAAVTEAYRPTPNNTVIGNKVKTIDRIIIVTNGYKHRAGIP